MVKEIVKEIQQSGETVVGRTREPEGQVEAGHEAREAEEQSAPSQESRKNNSSVEGRNCDKKKMEEPYNTSMPTSAYKRKQSSEQGHVQSVGHPVSGMV